MSLNNLPSVAVSDDLLLDHQRRVRKQRDRIERHQRARLSVDKLLVELRSFENALSWSSRNGGILA